MAPASVAWQQRAVQVERAFFGQRQQWLAQQVAVVEREDVIRVELGDPLDPQRMVGVFRCVNRDAFVGAQLRNRGVEGVLLRVIGMGKYRRNVIATVEQGLNAGAANIVVSEDNGFCAHERT